MTDWIPIGLRLPEAEQLCWIATTFKARPVILGRFRTHFGSDPYPHFCENGSGERFVCPMPLFQNDSDVAAWMPCQKPEPYKP